MVRKSRSSQSAPFSSNDWSEEIRQVIGESGACELVSNKITLNVLAIDGFGQATSADSRALFAAMVAHEGTHLSGGFLGRIGIGNYMYVGERRPLFSESYVYQGCV